MKTGYSFGSLVSFTEALNAAAVKITGDQTIAGVKTFSSNPISSAAQGSGGSHLTRKDYVDGALALKAPLASPALSGTPTAPTAAVGTNTTQLATTAFVKDALATLVPVEASSANPLMNGMTTAGTSDKYSREDHVHPTDTSRAPLASPALTGTPTAPTAAAGTDTTQVATTAFVTASNTAQLGTAAPLMDGTAAVGTSTLLARQDHTHPTDTSRAPLASPALTGTPTAPTAAAGTDTTQLATTAFVTGAIGALKNSLAAPNSTVSIAGLAAGKVANAAGIVHAATIIPGSGTQNVTAEQTGSSLVFLSATDVIMPTLASLGGITGHYRIMAVLNPITLRISGGLLFTVRKTTVASVTIPAGSDCYVVYGKTTSVYVFGV